MKGAFIMLGFGNKKGNTQNLFAAPKSTTRTNQNDEPKVQMNNESMDNQSGFNHNKQPMDTAGNEQELQAYIDQRSAEIDHQVKEFSDKNPNFDMGKEMQNPEFCTYIWGNGLSVEDAYYLTHKDNNGIDNSQKKSNYYSQLNHKRIAENGIGRQGGNGMVKKNPKDLSDEEIDDIVKRVRDGEKISF